MESRYRNRELQAQEIRNFFSECEELKLRAAENASDEDKRELARAMKRSMVTDYERICKTGEGVKVREARRKRDVVSGGADRSARMKN